MAQSASAFLGESPARPSAADFLRTHSDEEVIVEGLRKIQSRAAKEDAPSSLLPDPFAYRPSTAAKIGLRVIPPLTVGVGTGGLGLIPAILATAAAGGAGEAAAQGIEVAGGEREDISLPQLGTATVLSGVPGLPLGRVASPLVRGGIRVGEGATLGATAPALEAAFEGRKPKLQDIASGAGFGALLASPFGLAEAARKPAMNAGAKVLAQDAAKPASIANEAAIGAKNAEGNLTQLQKQINEMAVTPVQTVTREQRLQELEGAFGTAKGENVSGKAASESAAVLEQAAQQEAMATQILALKEARIQTLIDGLSGNDDQTRRKLLALRQATDEDGFLAALEAESDFRVNPQRHPERLAQEVQAHVQAQALRRAETSISPVELTQPRAVLQGISMAGGTPEEVAMLRRGLAPLDVPLQPVAPASFIGVQEGIPGRLPDIELYNLTEAIPGHPAGSTVSRQTLESAGFALPEIQPVSALQVESPVPRVLRTPTPRSEQLLELPGVRAGDQLQARPAAQAETVLGSESGRVSIPAMSSLAGGATGGATGFITTEREPGETEEEFQARRLRNSAIGAGIGAAGGYGLGALAKGAQKAGPLDTPKATQPKGARVDLPEVEEGQGIRQTAEKVIENRQYPERLRQVLADDPEIVYDKFALNDLKKRVTSATIEDLAAMRASNDRNARVASTIELANRYAVTGKPDEAAALYAEAAKSFTSPAQLLNVAKLVRSPQAFVGAVNEQLAQVNRKLTKPQENELTKLAAKSIKAEQGLEVAEQRAIDDFSEVNEKAYKDAQRELGQSKKDIDDYVHQVSPEGWDDIASKAIQGNLLTPLSLVANVFGNLVYQPVRRGGTAVASAIDAVYSGLTGKERKIAQLLPLPARGELKAAGEGIKIAAKELITGPSADSYIKAEVQRGFRPLRSFVQAFSGKNLPVREDGTVALGDRAKKFIEGTVGIAPEIMFRFLNLGDKPFRRAAEAEILLEQARLKGLKGRELDKFLEFPDEATRKLIDTEGRRAIFAQENKGVTKLNQFLDSGVAELLRLDQIPAAKGALKVFNRIVVPFRQFPVNYVMTALNFAAPELAVAKSVYHAGKGDRRKALINLGEGALGAMMYGGASYLWEHGLISEPTDKDAKARSVQYEQMGPQRINISGLNRSLEGGDPNFQYGDLTMDWGRMGIPASVFYVHTRNAAKDKKEEARLGPVAKPESNYAVDRLSAIPGMTAFALDQSFLSGTAAFLEALKDWDESGPNWAQNSFRAVTSLAVPNSFEALARAEYKYVPELKGDTLLETLKNTWDYKTLELPEGDRALLKRDLWGKPILRNPEGKNPYVNQFLDVTRSERKNAPQFKTELLKLYEDTESPEVYPTAPGRNMTIQGVTVKLDPQDYEDLQQFVGAYRQRAAEIILNSPRYKNARSPEERIYLLQKGYSAGAEEGRNLLLQKPGVAEKIQQAVTGEDSERVVGRDVRARARVRASEFLEAARN